MGATRQREAIFNIICQSPDHMTADEIYTLVRATIPNIGLGTVYRNLGILADSHQIQRIKVPGESDRYDKNPARHIHFWCEGCRRLMDIDVDPPDFTDCFRGHGNIVILDCTLSVTGYCASCAPRYKSKRVTEHPKDSQNVIRRDGSKP